jgi:hypothetical protein
VFTRQLVLVDVSFVHPAHLLRWLRYLLGSQMLPRTALLQAGHQAHVSVESFQRLGVPAMSLLGALANEGAGWRAGLFWDVFILVAAYPLAPRDQK